MPRIFIALYGVWPLEIWCLNSFGTGSPNFTLIYTRCYHPEQVRYCLGATFRGLWRWLPLWMPVIRGV